MIFREFRRRLYYRRKEVWRRSRLVFPSPAEVEFVRVMGGKAITFRRIRARKTGFPLVIMWAGFFLNREFVEREKRVGAYYIDFAFETRNSKKGIEIDGAQYHRDIIKEQDRDDYLAARGWRIMHIRASDLYNSPYSIIQRVRNFLS